MNSWANSTSKGMLDTDMIIEMYFSFSDNSTIASWNGRGRHSSSGGWIWGSFPKKEINPISECVGSFLPYLLHNFVKPAAMSEKGC